MTTLRVTVCSSFWQRYCKKRKAEEYPTGRRSFAFFFLFTVIFETARKSIYDIVVDLLLANGGKARKGNGRNHKMGEPECDETTVVGAIGKYYWGKEDGESVLDPVFVVAAVLEWAGIARNERGELSLTSYYRSML